MKKIIYIIIAFVALPCFGEESLKGYVEYSDSPFTEIILEPQEPEHLNLSAPQKFEAKSLKAVIEGGNNLYSAPHFSDMSNYSSLEYAISPIGGATSNGKGRFSYGTTFSSAIDSSQLENTTKIYTRYATKHVAVSTAYGKSISSGTWEGADTFYVAPEIILGKGFALRDVMSNNITYQKYTNELVLLYHPQKTKHLENLEFELGAGQTFYRNAGTKTSIRFSTSFKL